MSVLLVSPSFSPLYKINVPRAKAWDGGTTFAGDRFPPSNSAGSNFGLIEVGEWREVASDLDQSFHAPPGIQSKAKTMRINESDTQQEGGKVTAHRRQHNDAFTLSRPSKNNTSLS